MKISYNWLKSYIDGKLPTPEKLGDVLTFALCEIEDIETLADGDAILDVNILPNRAHDLLSHQGMAREIAGILKLPYKDPTALYTIPELKPTELKIDIQTQNCRRYMGRIVRNVKVGPSPDWVIKYLAAIGQRSINNIVDATNIVMYDSGQPCHAYELCKVENSKIVVTQATEEESLPVVGSEKIVAKLNASDMVITDGAKSLAIAGVKGGLDSGMRIGEEYTTDILLEVANFDPIAVRKTARRLALLSDSAKRFENDLSPEHASFGMLELSGLIAEMCPDAVFEQIVDVYPVPQMPRTINFHVQEINHYLGTTLTEVEMLDILRDYGFEIYGSSDSYTLEVPALRLDMIGAHDIAEEVLRLYGLDNIKPEPLSFSEVKRDNSLFFDSARARAILIALGYREVMTYAFRKKGVHEVAHGVGDKSFVRTDLAQGLKDSYEANRLRAPLFGLDEIKIFEIGSVFPKTGEVVHIAWADKKGVTEMPLVEFLKSKIAIDSAIEAPLVVETNEAVKPFVQWSEYPFITRDIAVWVPETVSAEELESIYLEFGTALLSRTPRLFDTFTKDGKTSYAHRLVFQSNERTLTDQEVTQVVTVIGEKLRSKGWEIR